MIIVKSNLPQRMTRAKDAVDIQGVSSLVVPLALEELLTNASVTVEVSGASSLDVM